MEKLGWNGSIENYYPRYKSYPFENFEDLRVFIKKEENKKYFNGDLL